MIYLIIVIILMAGGGYLLFQSNRKKKKEITKLGDKVIDLLATIIERDHVITGMEVINRETTKKKKKIRTGTDSDKFDNSLDILSDLSKSGAGKD